MFCRYCGQELKDDAIFCNKCGKSLKKNIVSEENKELKDESIKEKNIVEDEVPNVEEVIEEVNDNVHIQDESTNINIGKPSLKIDKKIIGIILALVIVIAGVVFLTNRPNAYNLEEYVSFVDSGYNGEGECKVKFSENRLKSDIAEKEYIDRMFLERAFISDAAPTVDIVSESENLSNGDIVVAEITFSKGFAKSLGVRFKGKKIEHTVEGLEEATIKDEVAALTPEPTPEIENAHEHQFIYESDGKESHIKKCTIAGCNFNEKEKCSFETNNKCICGNINPEEAVKEEFYHKYKGMWLDPNSEYYYIFNDNGETQRGYLETDDIYIGKIDSIKESENGYNVRIIEEPFETEWGDTYDGSDFTLYLKETQLDTLIDIGKTEPYYLMQVSYTGDIDKVFDNYQEKLDSYTTQVEIENPDYFKQSPEGKWFTADYDEQMNWATSYVIKLDDKGNAISTGYRDNDTGKYEMISPNTALITFTNCTRDAAGEGWVVIDGYSYTVEMKINGDEATITVNDPEITTNLPDGKMYRAVE